MTFFFFIGVVALGIVWIILTHNKLVRYQHLVEEAWSGMDVQLKRRADLIPNIVKVVKGYQQHEKRLIQEVTRLRSKSLQIGEIGKRIQLEGDITRSLANLFAIVENYPDLKANHNFLDLQKQLVEVEDHIQMARRYYNGTVRNINILIESFPSNLVAQLFRFSVNEFYEIEDPIDRHVPRIDV